MSDNQSIDVKTLPEALQRCVTLAGELAKQIPQKSRASDDWLRVSIVNELRILSQSVEVLGEAEVTTDDGDQPIQPADTKELLACLWRLEDSVARLTWN